MSTRPIHLVRIVLYAAYDRTRDETTDAGIEALADGLAEQLRADDRVLTVATDVDDTEQQLDAEDNDALADALTAQWPELTDEEREMLDEAIDSHVYWQLSDTEYRSNGAVQDPGSDEEENAEAITKFQTLAVKLAAPKATRVAVADDTK